ncbi:MAG TPA: hypothetical protein VHG33_09545, partial [Woeseiaceae bacterium]|nr:hypothetical protein [Woeseiaceae bacterium]
MSGGVMADPADRIHELKIDRSAPPAPGRGALWAALAAGVLVLALAAWWFSAGAARGGIAVQTEIVREPVSHAAVGSVLDASGY